MSINAITYSNAKSRNGSYSSASLIATFLARYDNQGRSGRRMSYDDKLNLLADAIEVYVQFDAVEQAKEWSQWHTASMGSPLYNSVHNMARQLYNCDERTGIAEILSTIGHSKHGCDERPKLSALRDAIRLCAVRAVRREELEELARIGTIDRTAGALV